jgi:hypothetical protein
MDIHYKSLGDWVCDDNFSSVDDWTAWTGALRLRFFTILLLHLPDTLPRQSA